MSQSDFFRREEHEWIGRKEHIQIINLFPQLPDDEAAEKISEITEELFRIFSKYEANHLQPDFLA